MYVVSIYLSLAFEATGYDVRTIRIPQLFVPILGSRIKDLDWMTMTQKEKSLHRTRDNGDKNAL
jgi:hypothetical protein